MINASKNDWSISGFVFIFLYCMSSMHAHRNYASDMNASLPIGQFAYYCTENNLGKLARRIKIYDTSIANQLVRVLCYES